MTRQNREKVRQLLKEYHEWSERSLYIEPKWLSQTTKTNGLTQFVVYWFRLHGWHSERITSGGRFLKQQTTYTNVLGQIRTAGRDKFIPSTSQSGTADVEGTVRGVLWKIEIKNSKTKDRSAKHQKVFGELVELSGANYIVVTDVDSFIEWYETKLFGVNESRFEFWKKAREMRDTSKNNKHKYLIR